MKYFLVGSRCGTAVSFFGTLVDIGTTVKTTVTRLWTGIRTKSYMIASRGWHMRLVLVVGRAWLPMQTWRARGPNWIRCWFVVSWRDTCSRGRGSRSLIRLLQRERWAKMTHDTSLEGGSVVISRLIFTSPPEDETNRQKLHGHWTSGADARYDRSNSFLATHCRSFSSKYPTIHALTLEYSYLECLQ